MMHCPDFLEFQDILKKMRTLDDKIVYSLNTSVLTESFRAKTDPTTACKDLFDQIQNAHTDRENIIKNCILVSADTLKKLRGSKEQNPNDFEVNRKLKAEQSKLRLLQSELSIEEIIKEKTNKVFNEKCRGYYKPPNSL